VDELIAEVAVEEAALAGGTELGIGSNTVMALRESHVSYGYPWDRLFRLTPDLLEEMALELDPVQKRQLETTYDFYHMTLNVSLFPRRGMVFKRLEHRLDFRSLDGGHVIVQRMFPAARYRNVLSWGGKLSLGLTGTLDWRVGVEEAALADLEELRAGRADFVNQNELGAAVVVPEFSFNMGRFEINATGEGTGTCLWRLEQPELKESQTIPFVVIFKVLKGTRAIELEGVFICEPDMEYLTANLSHVLSELSEKFKALFRKRDSERSAEERMPLGAHELWSPIELPV